MADNIPPSRNEPTENQYTDAAKRFLSIIRLVASKPVCTAYEIARALDLPVSSTYQAVNELERLSWLARDEDGYLLVGNMPQQVALHALGYEITAHRLVPVIRYLRDQTGETVMTASLKDDVQVGSCLVGFNPNSVGIAPFQRYRLGGLTTIDVESGAMSLKIIPTTEDGIERRPVDLIAIPLMPAAKECHDGVLILGICRNLRILNETTLLRRLLEVRHLISNEN